MMHYFLYRGMFFGLLLGALLFSSSFAFAENEDISVLNEAIEQKKTSIEQINRQINQYEQKIDEMQSWQASLETELTLLQNRIAKTRLELTKTDEEIELANAEIQQLEQELSALQAKLEEQRQLIAHLLQKIQVADNDLPLQVIFGTESIAELFNQVAYLETVSTELKQSVEDVKQTQSIVAQKQTDQIARKEQLVALQIALQNDEQQLGEEVGAEQALLQASAASESEFQYLLSQIKAEQSFVESQIRELQTQVESKLNANDAIGDSSILSWPIDPSARGISAYYHDPSYPFRHLFEHSGLDLPASIGTPVRAAASGYVAWAKTGRLYGNYVMIIHTNGLATLYAHLSRMDVVADQFITRGQTIGAVGSTGLSTGPHVHFEVRKDGIPVNPLDYLVE